jgi:hypothetical protein
LQIRRHLNLNQDLYRAPHSLGLEEYSLALWHHLEQLFVGHPAHSHDPLSTLIVTKIHRYITAVMRRLRDDQI